VLAADAVELEDMADGVETVVFESAGTGLIVVALEAVVVPPVVTIEVLHAAAIAMVPMTAPVAVTPALFKNWRLENLATRKMSLIPRFLCSSCSDIFGPFGY